MTKVEITTKTTYIIDLPIDSFEDIKIDKMSITESDKMIIDFLADNLDVGVDEIVRVIPVEY